MKQVSIDHIEISDSLIEVNYWVSQAPEKESVLFKTKEFENWLTTQRQVSMNHYWTHWTPANVGSYGHKIVCGDIENYFLHKMQALSVGALHDFSISGKKPMTRVSDTKTKQKGSRSA